MNAPISRPAPVFKSDETRWRAIERRDARADGAFWTCVRTTGVYCRPSCAGRPKRENVFFVDHRAEARAAGMRPCKRCRPDRFLAGALGDRVGEVDWAAVSARLDEGGWARLGRLLTDAECDRLIALYGDDAKFRASVDMRRCGFGAGAYRYFADPAPALVAGLRASLYPRLAPVANCWREALGRRPQPYPDSLAEYRRECARRGQRRPTPLLLKYGAGDYNRLHQDRYGKEIFPLQVAVLLSAPGRDFEGGEFVMTEQAPRRQSRVCVAPLERGDAVVFAVDARPVAGAKGSFRAIMRHGVSEIRAGTRYCLGVIFHDAE